MVSGENSTGQFPTNSQSQKSGSNRRCIVWAVPPGEVDFIIDQVNFSESGQPQIEFTGEPGWTYQVEYTEDLSIWNNDLSGSDFSGIEEPTQVQFIDPTQRISTNRWYRVKRSITP
jgi:hypothetical protein